MTMNSLKILIWILLFNLMISNLTRKKFEIVLPFSLLGASIFLFITGLLGSIILGYYIINLIIIIFYVWKFILFLKNKQTDLFKEIINNKNILIVIILFLLILIMNYNKGFHQWDDYMHWGSMVKYNLMFDKLYCNADGFAFAHKDYPPIASLYETLWCFIAGGYSEAICIQSLQFLSVSLLFPIFVKNQKIVLKIIATLIIMTIWLVLPNLSSFFYGSLYVDVLLGVIFGYGLYYVFFFIEDKIDYVFFVVLGIFLVLIKQIGLAFYLLLIIAFIFRKLFVDSKIKYRINWLAYIVLLIPIIFYIVWLIYLQYVNVSGELVGQFSYGDLRVFDIINIIIGKSGETWQILTARNFLKALIFKPLTTYLVSISYVEALLIINIIWMITTYILKENLKKKLASLIIYDIGAIGYAFGMLLLYVFAFGNYEGPILASYERYMSSYILAGVIFLLLVYNTRGQLILWMLSIFLLVSVNDYQLLKPTYKYSSWGDEVKKFADYIDEKTNENDKILMISQGEKNIHNFIVAYYCMPTRVNGYSFGEPKYEGDIYSIEISQEDFDALIDNNDYLYIYNFDEYSNNLLKKYIDINNIEFSTLYKIENNKLIQVD